MVVAELWVVDIVCSHPVEIPCTFATAAGAQQLRRWWRGNVSLSPSSTPPQSDPLLVIPWPSVRDDFFSLLLLPSSRILNYAPDKHQALDLVCASTFDWWWLSYHVGKPAVLANKRNKRHPQINIARFPHWNYTRSHFSWFGCVLCVCVIVSFYLINYRIKIENYQFRATSI